MQSLQKELSVIVGADAVLTDPIQLRAYDCDAYTIEKSLPTVVTLPQETAQVAEIVKVANRLDLPVIPRGAGTGLSGGSLAVNGGILIATTRMNRILSVDARNRRLRAQSGAVNIHLSKAAKPFNLHYAPDPSSQGACTVGGNVAENAGGPHTLKYGVTVNHITGLTMVLPDGEIVELGDEVEDPGGCDLVGVVVGSEGTLGIVTEVVARLTPLPAAYRTLLAIFETLDDATRSVSQLIAAGIVPAALELMDKLVLEAVEAAFGYGFPLDAEAVLLIELDGVEAGLDRLQAQAIEICHSNHARETRIARDPLERAKLWAARKKAIGALGRLAPSCVTQDGVIPRARLSHVLREAGEIAHNYGLRLANVFHAGDGNLHPVLLFDDSNPDEVERVAKAGDEILALCLREGGSLSGEHGIGTEKCGLMNAMFSSADLETMRMLKNAFNPDDRCNPEKIFPDTRYCYETKYALRKPAFGL
ncbi:MAG: FAD-binding protein [Fimbriimonadia bacterium]|nr:FAD-binding protein [Fimbriimonadia bacterium]